MAHLEPFYLLTIENSFLKTLPSSKFNGDSINTIMIATFCCYCQNYTLDYSLPPFNRPFRILKFLNAFIRTGIWYGLLTNGESGVRV